MSRLKTSGGRGPDCGPPILSLSFFLLWHVAARLDERESDQISGTD